MTGLNLFQHLCNLARLATSALDNASSCEVSGATRPSHFHFHNSGDTCVCVCSCVGWTSCGESR